MSMSKEDGWEDYHCYDCGKLLGHFYVGFGWMRLWGWVRMIYYTLWKNCRECSFKFWLRLTGGRTWMVSTPMIENSWFQRVWEEAREK